MKPRPTIFLSGVSCEFASFRDAIEIEIQKKGCFVENQSSFATDYRAIEAMLRQKLSEADAVIHIAGFRYGAEPQQRPAGAPHRSYTQMEYDIARELDKPIYCFLSSDASVRDAPTGTELPEPQELTDLQAAHRATVKSTDNIRYSFRDKQELCSQVAAIQIIASGFDFRVDISRIDQYAPAELIGRESELALLDDALLKVRRAESPRARVLTFVALGGEGKTSLIAKWAAQLAHHNWPGCDTVFAWSFYSQGTRDQVAASSDLFLKEAITFFGNEYDKDFAASSAGAYEKGQRLARIVGDRRALLVLDGLEPLQYAPTSPTPGELKDAGVAALLKSLAANSKGLCIVTTRYSLPNLRAYWQTTAPEIKLLRLSRAAGADLLKSLGVHGSTLRNIAINDGKEQVNEFEKLVEDVKGHALTLNLLGTFLRDAHAGDIRRRDLVKLEEADAEEHAGHAFRVMEAYERVFDEEGEKGKRALATLRLLGLFDRPLPVDLWIALLKGSAIPDLTEPLIGVSEAQHNLILKRLEDARLLTVNRDSSGALISMDAHPLLREYFGRQLRTDYPASWTAAHRRLYEHLCSSTPDKVRPTLEDLQPLYQAVAHGCQAGLYEEACGNVYYKRIYRGANENYSMRELGAFGSDLGAIRCFFESPWSGVSPVLSDSGKRFVLSIAAFALHGMGRLAEALQPMRSVSASNVEAEDWSNASVTAGNLSDLQLTLGQLIPALQEAEAAVTYADKTDSDFKMMGRRAAVADVLHQCGRYAEAVEVFEEAEQLQIIRQPEYPRLYSFLGFRYCDLLLAPFEVASWKRTLAPDEWLAQSNLNEQRRLAAKALEEIAQRATDTVQWAQAARAGVLIEIGLDHLTLARTAFYKALLVSNEFSAMDNSLSKNSFDSVIAELRRGGRQDLIPHGLLMRAWFEALIDRPDAGVQEDLDEAWEIAERGPMRLHMADIHLYRARLFFREEDYPWESAKADLEAAERLINECGYHRRDEELADAKRAILGI